MRRGLAHQIDFAVSNLAANRHPAAIDGDTRALPFERLQMLFFEKTFEASLRIAAVLADYAHGAAFRRFRDQPVKVRRVVRHEPDARSEERRVGKECRARWRGDT